MSYPGTLNAIQGADSPSVDAFGRWRVSNPQLLLSAPFEDDLRPLLFQSLVVATGTVTHVVATSTARLRVAANGDSALLQSRQYFSYRTGQSQAIDMTGHPPTPTTGYNYEMGYGDAANGIFLRVEGTDITLVRRAYGVDEPISQASWNLDTLGAGALNPSGETLTLDGRAQILVADLQWLGEGRMRIGFNIGGGTIYCHEFLWANEAGTTTPYMKTARLPVRWYLENVAGGVGNWDFNATCASVVREGGEQEPSNTFGVDTYVTSYAAPTATLNAILAIRPAAANPRIALVPVAVSFAVEGSDPIYWQLVRNPTIGVALSYGAVGGGSLVEYSTSNSAITYGTGTVVASGHVAGGAAGGRGTVGSERLAETLAAVADIAGTTTDQYVLAVRSLGAGSSATNAALTFREIR